MSVPALRTISHYSQPSPTQLGQSNLRSASTPSISFISQNSTFKSVTSPSVFKRREVVSKGLGFRVQATSMAEVGVEKGKEKRKLHFHDTEEAIAAELAKYTADLSDKFAKQRGTFTVVVSGGSLIKSLRKLTEPPYADSIDWSKWHVFWADERVVPKDHPDSNYKLAYDGFLSKVPIPPGNVYAINDTLSAEGAADDYEACLKKLLKNGVLDTSSATGFPKFDLMLLGMGPDGHIASLFPGHPLVQEKQRLVTFIKDSPKPPPERITFTFPVINSSAYIAMVVCGAGKAGAVKTALGKNEESLPAGMVSAEEELTWFLDGDAASKL